MLGWKLNKKRMKKEFKDANLGRKIGIQDNIS